MLLSKYDQVDRFDVVVLKERLTEGGDTKNIVKRVIGMGGERVTVVNGQLFIDNVAYNEYYLDNENIKAFGNTSLILQFQTVITLLWVIIGMSQRILELLVRLKRMLLLGLISIHFIFQNYGKLAKAGFFCILNN